MDDTNSFAFQGRFGFNPNAIDPIEERWDYFIEQILKGNVIPVIGPDMLIAEHKNCHQLIINQLAGAANIKPNHTSFSQLLFDKKFTNWLGNQNCTMDAIYRTILPQATQWPLTPHPLLKRLLETKRFPFVITTSFMPIVERCMREIYGENNVRVLQFNNDSQRSMKVDFGDIRNEKELERPTVFYMFGRLCSEPHRYVVTDMDMMEFCKTWMTGNGVPRTLTECLKKRYLLFLGGNYSDWLFRFIWFSMRHNSAENHRASMFVMPENSHLDLKGFENFLERLQAFTQHDPEAVITQIEQRLSKYDEQQEHESQSEYGFDVFLSYSRRDSEIANRLCEELKKREINVWFDDQTISRGDNWELAIKDGIPQSKLFVPLLTQTVMREYIEPHEYRAEWDVAANIAKRLGRRAFIIPVAENGFDFYDTNTKLPEQLKQVNAVWYTSGEDISNVADVIEKTLKELNEQKNKLNY